MKKLSIMGIIITSCLVFPNVFAVQLNEEWVWQKGIGVSTAFNTNAVEMGMTMPSGKISSWGTLSNYVGAYTNNGDFIQMGVFFKNTVISKISTTPFFYEDGYGHTMYLAMPYVEGHHYRFGIDYNNGWQVYVADDDTGKKIFGQANWASGKTLSSVQIILENVATFSKDNILNSASQMGTLSNIVDETWMTFTNGKWSEQYSQIPCCSQIATNKQPSAWISHSVPPPSMVIFENSGNGKYLVGFTPSSVSTNTLKSNTNSPTSIVPSPSQISTQKQPKPSATPTIISPQKTNPTQYSRISIVNTSYKVNPSTYLSIPFSLSCSALVTGTFSAHAGLGNNIDLFVFDQSNFQKYQNHVAISPLYYNLQRGTGIFNLPLTSGNYYVVLSNLYSVFSTKNVDLQASYTCN